MRITKRWADLWLAGTMLAGVSPALAQATDPSTGSSTAKASGEAGGEIVVTGFRASQRSATKAKKNAAVILDAVSQDDVGRLPDLNIVEASRRITGVSVVGGADPTKNRDIYQRATIRGLDPRYNLVTIDGIPLASPDWVYRGARLDMLPASLVSRIEAIKSVSAQYDPHALGGQINIVSKSAFDQQGHSFFVVNANGGYNDTTGKLVRGGGASIRTDATASRVFGSGDQFGVVASVEYQRLPSTARAELPGDSNGAGWSYFTAAGARTAFPGLSNGNLVPVRNQDYFFENMRTRLSGNLKLEWRPDDATAVSLFGGYYHDTDTETRYEALTQPTGAPIGTTLTSGRFAQGDTQQGLTFQPVNRDTWLVDMKGRHDFGSGWVLDATIARSKALYREHREMIKYDVAPRAGAASNGFANAFGYSYTLVDGRPRLTFNDPVAAADPNSYKNLYYRDIHRDLDSTVQYATANLGYNSGADDRGAGLNVGVATTRTDVGYDQTYLEYVPGTVAGQAAVGTLAGLLYPERPATYETPGVPYLLLNRAAAWARFAANRSAFIATNQVANNVADDFNDIERVKAAYLQGLYRTERFDLRAGVRYDRTDLVIDTNQLVNATTYTPQRRTTGYGFWLPSALATYDLGDGMRLRAGVSKTIGRPDYSQYAARTTFGVGTDGTLTINTGNPALKPREAWNYDLSYEWYLGGAGMVSLAGFAKDIRNEIFTSSQAGSPTSFAGVTYQTVFISTPRNAACARVKGIEASYTLDRIAAIPGLGVNANITLLDGSFDQPVSAAGIATGLPRTRRTTGLIQQPAYIANMTVFYVAGPVELRASYNRIGRALQSADGDTPTRDLYQEPRQQLDMQARVTLREGVELVGQVQNLTKEPFIVRQGVRRDYVNYYFPVGRTFWLGLSWKPKW
ncbi:MULTISPECIES: TonB-dependent receptor [unclassified Sphingomonas]|uniref:TonB-dependent receptor n=1 Tax=unclassified Sphingomonas TaxID=196159 RepID=UPI00285CD553|nr:MULTISPECIES: TonB-dependent receptor [unclassified Sphingomonas]MDR6116280.1 iron complex outermembrane receptor protein [Sphingomonas sp. SORGH_AS_0789]MDR6150045.1 iron complex outermembrane receptor protein [Sphingomonas sp. SORGH_AS_0742]